jgi:pentatricopeptide repeat protein
MGIRNWLHRRFGGAAGEDRPPGSSIVAALFGRERPRGRPLGEYDRHSYPDDLREALRRREEVAAELREMDLTTREARIASVPRLREMLRVYPHPLAYATLIQAYVDEGRWDEARGAVFAARERRNHVSRSPFPEIRAEIDRLPGWTPEELEELRREREGGTAPPQ